MEDKILENIKKYKLINKSDKVFLGISGGHDSLALLNVLYRLRKELDFELIMAHVNHGVRKESQRDKEELENLSKKLGLEFLSIDVDMEGYAREKRISDEEAGRILRHDFFKGLVDKNPAGKIALGHNMNDQAETLLMRIIRGTGLDGLKAMNFKDDYIIRPLLNIKREEIESYVEEEGLRPLIDWTNQEDIYHRNSIRLNLIPFIEENYNPKLVEGLFRLSQLARDDIEFLDDITRNFYKKLVSKDDELSISLSQESFNNLEKPIKFRLFRMIVEEMLGSLEGLARINVELAIDFIEEGESGKRIDIIKGLGLELVYGKLIFSIKEEPEEYKEKLIINNDFISYPNGYKIRCRKISKEEYIKRDKNIKGHSYIDYGKVKGELFVRTRKNGDKFKNLGMKSKKKLKDYFIDRKIPRDERDRLPLILDGEEIVYIVSLDISQDYRVDNNSEEILEIEGLRE